MQQNYRRSIFLLSIVMIIIGLPFSKPLISMGEIILFANWLFDKNLFQKIKNFLNNKMALLFSSTFLLLIIGLVWTSNFDYGFFDIKTKLPLIFMPLVFSTGFQLYKKEIKLLLFLFVLAVTVSISISFVNYLLIDIQDVRDSVLFVSHIRLSIMVVLSICIILYYLFLEKNNWTSISAYILFIILLIAQMLMLEMMTGLLLLFSTAIIISFIIILKSFRKILAITLSGVVVLTLVTTFLSIRKIVQDYENTPSYSISRLPTRTINGNLYHHLPENFPVENGSYIGLYICNEELRECWEYRSSICFDSLDLAGQPISFTITRFLNSKHLTKDSMGISKLSDNEIKEIEKGIANVVYLESFSLRKRIYKILWEYNLYRNSGLSAGQSVIQRFELWKTGIELLKKNMLVGVGTGDVKDSFKKQLHQHNADIHSELGVHNQYIRTAVSFGIPGLLLFVIVIFLPIVIQMKEKNWLYLSFAITLAISMFWEDTIETQVGVTIYAFFNSFYWFFFSNSKQ